MTNMVEKAFLFALKVHGGQTRKDGKPYITHPFSVAMELAKNGANDELICAGLLHDTIEDGGVTPEELKREFGEEVLRLVLFDTENKKLSWKERKDATLLALENCDRKCAMLICADKLSNIRDLSEGLKAEGESIWNKFKYGIDRHLCCTKKLQHTKSTRYCVSCAFLLLYLVFLSLDKIFEFNSCISALFGENRS